MIYHSIYTITINNYGLAFEFPNKVKRFPIWMPKKWTQKAFNKLTHKYNKITEASDNNTILNDRYYVTNLEARINLYGTMFHVYKNAWIVEPPDEMHELYKEHFRKDFDIDGLQLIVNRIGILKDRHLTAVNKLKQPEQQKEFDFIDFHVRLEGWLTPETIGNKKLYMMPHYISKVNKIIKQKEQK